ncbi:MAG: MBL fold metallo-hydrolase [Candidatus Binatia bacterium]
MERIDYDNAVAITRDIHWIGFYDAKAKLHCNPYLLVDDGDVVVIDPGSIPDFPVVMRKILDLVAPEAITHVIAQHQDPDVCGNLAVIEDVIGRSDLRIVAHTNTIRLIRHYGVSAEFYAVDEHDYRLTLRSGRVLDFLFTPYLHSPGAIVTFDRKTRSIFTSDIFGALSSPTWSLFGSGDFRAEMGMWHQTYMSSGRALRECVERIEGLGVERILPQHGSVLEGEAMHAAIAFLKTLPCGADLPIGG